MSEILEREIIVSVCEYSSADCGYFLYADLIGVGDAASGLDRTGDKIVHRETISIEVPDFDPVAALLGGLEAEKAKLMAEHSQAMSVIEDKISKLTALPAPEAT